MTGLTFDVYYYEKFAHVAGILFECGKEEKTIKKYTKIVYEVNPYIPGEFYKRELPCILSLLKDINETYDFILLDSYVYIKENHKGLGAYLYEYLDKTIPIMGLAKNHFKDVENYRELERGKSKKKLYITSAGIDLDFSYNLIKNMEGQYRLPDIIKEVDKLSRLEIDKGEI